MPKSLKQLIDDVEAAHEQSADAVASFYAAPEHMKWTRFQGLKSAYENWSAAIAALREYERK